MLRFIEKMIGWADFHFLRRIVLGCLAFVLVLGSVLVSSYYHKTFDAMEEQMLQSIQQNAEQISLNVSYRLKNINEISTFLLQNVELYEILNRSGLNDDMAQQLSDFDRLKEITDVVYGGENIYALRIFLSGDKIYSREGISFFDLNAITNTQLGQVIHAEKGLTFLGWTGVYHEKYLDKPSADIVSNVRLVRDHDNYNRIVAAIAIDVQEMRFYDILSRLRQTDETVKIIDAQGNVVSGTDRGNIGKKSRLSAEALTEITRTQNGFLRAQLTDEPYFVVYSAIPETNWYVTISVPQQTISQNSRGDTAIAGLSTIFIAIIFFMLLLMLVFTMVSDVMVHRIKEIALHIQDQGEEALAVSPTKDRYLQKIQNYIREMSATISRLNKEAYEAKIKERDYQLKALQAQINPHFLYNTLDSINWMAMRRGAADISGMVTALAKYFRLSLNKGRDIITLGEEAELVNTYISIQQVRFDSIVKWDCAIDPGCAECKIPKLTLQPIVENALLHGICGAEREEGTIAVRAYREDERTICILVNDDGIGMTEEEVKTVLSGGRKDDKKTGYGINNVNERIKLLYGAEYGLLISSRYHGGTSVKVRIPFMK